MNASTDKHGDAHSEASSSSPRFTELPLGAVRPGGWLRRQLELQATGITGPLEDVWRDVGLQSGWLGGPGESWERGPYYLDGLVALAYTLGDQGLIAQARKWIEWILDSQRENGWFGPAANDDWWPRMVALKALVQYADATGDERVPPFLRRYFAFQRDRLAEQVELSPISRIRATENLLTICWLHERTGEREFLDTARALAGRMVDWERYFSVFPYRTVTTDPVNLTHGPNIAMGLKTPGVLFLLDGDPAHYQIAELGLEHLDSFHGLASGMFSADEHLAGRDPTHGYETCAVVEMMFTLELFVRLWGATEHADRLEAVAFNSLAAAMTPDTRGHQYHQQPNQLLVSVARRNWTASGDDCNIFGLEPFFGCCTANLHQGWPKLVRSMWLATEDDGIAAVVHGPSRVTWHAPRGPVTIEAETNYPFGDTIRYTVSSSEPQPFPLLLRVPGWCERPEVKVGGAEFGATLDAGYLRLDRTWREGDTVELTIPALPRLVPRGAEAVSVTLGPLVMVEAPGEIWQQIGGVDGYCDWEVRPRRSWGATLAVDEQTVRTATVTRLEPENVPFGLRLGYPWSVDGVATKVSVPAVTTSSRWQIVDNVGVPPESLEIAPDARAHALELVPYGNARIRIAEFPNAGPLPPFELEDWELEPDYDQLLGE